MNRRTFLSVSGSSLAAGTVVALAGCSDRSNYEGQLIDVREATEQYTALSDARSAGFSYDNTISGMGHRLINDSRINTREPEQPSALLFGQVDAESDPVLGGVGYVITAEEQSTTPNLFDDEDRNLDPTEEEGWIPPDEPPEGVWELHLWVHIGNPDGVFARKHPKQEFKPQAEWFPDE